MSTRIKYLRLHIRGYLIMESQALQPGVEKSPLTRKKLHMAGDLNSPIRPYIVKILLFLLKIALE